MTPVGPAGILTGSLRRRRASHAAGIVAVTIAAAALAGWWAGQPLLSGWGVGLPAMQPSGALCLAVLGLALVCPGGDQRFAVVAGTTVAFVATFLLGAALLNVDAGAGIDWLALRSPVPPPWPDWPASRIVHASTVAFALTGAALGLSPFDRYRLAATVLAALAAAIAVFALLDYLTGIDTLYGPAVVTSPPLPTALGLLCVAFGSIMRAGAMPALRTPRPLWHLLALLGCAIIVPLLLFGAYAEVSLADAELNEVGRELTNGARALSASIDRQILGELERLQALAASPSLHQGDFASFQRQAEASLALRHNGNIMLFDRNMVALVNTFTSHGTSMAKAALSEPVAKALATGKPQFAGLFTGAVIGQEMLAIILPVEIDGEHRYALVREIGQRILTEPVAVENLPPGWQAMISDSRHILARTVLAPSDREGSDTALPQGSQKHPQGGPGGVFEFIDANGQPSLEGYAESDLTGWETAVYVSEARLEAPMRALWRTLGYLALMSLGLVVGLALWLGRLIAHSVGHVARAAAEPREEGNAPAPVGTPVAEVNALMAELREAAAQRQASQDLLRSSERQLRLVTSTAPVAIAHCDAEGRFTFVNKHFMERHGLSYEQIIGKRIPEVFGDAFAAMEPYIALCLAGTPVECELEVRNRHAEPLFLQGRFVPEWQDGAVVGLVGATSDITSLKQAEQRLRASETAFRQLVDDSPFGIYVVDADFRIVQASIGARKAFHTTNPLIGCDLAELINTVWSEPFATRLIGQFRHTLQTGEPYHSTGRSEQRRDTGAVESYDWQIERLTRPDGRFGIVCHFYDLSERHKYEAALRESEATFRAMFDSSAVGKIEVDVDTGRFLRANAAMCRLVGYTEPELLDRTVFDITHPDSRASDREALHQMDVGTLTVFDKEKRYIRKDGKSVWARVTANVVRNGMGRPLRNTAVIQDISERKQVEEDLKAGQTRLQLALGAAQLGWFQYDPARRSGWGDARFREIFDLDDYETPLDELLARMHPEDEGRARASLAASLNPDNPQPFTVEYRVRRRDGKTCWVEIHALANFDGAGCERRAVNLIGTAQDITERKQHEEHTQLLMREVNHRAKNMLSVVDAIAHQTAARNPEDFITRFSERIQALSANQDLLVRNEWKGVDIDDLARTQLAHFSDLIGSRIVMRGPALRLQAASAQAIGLALHELATNAGKYGALSAGAGHVDIGWRTDGDTFLMRWTEIGGPPVSPPNRRGFGSVVMEMMAERSVAGKVDLDYAPAGITWRLTCPAANVLEHTEGE